MPQNSGSDRQWAGMSRVAKRVTNNLGIIPAGSGQSKLYRRDILHLYDQYYECKQYKHLPSWEDAARAACEGDYISVRGRQPRMQYAFAKMLCARVASKLVGETSFPKVSVEEDPEAEEFFRLVLKLSKLPARLIEPVRRLLNAGSQFVRFFVVEGTLKIESYLSKYCYPVFDATGELASVRIQYVFEDPAELDEKGRPSQKWYRLDLTQTTDTLYNNPKYVENADPEFEVVRSVAHDFGYVQGQWFRTSEDKHAPDGSSLIGDIMEFIDEMNYSLSQSSQAVQYNQEPQLTLSGMDEDAIENLVRSSQKAWSLGREGKAEFLETAMEGVTTATELRDKVRLGIQDIARVVLLDPEKVVGHAQSGKAMEVLHGPLVELINELRPLLEEQLQALVLKIAITLLQLIQRGEDVGLEVPKGFKLKTLDFDFKWQPIFPMTMNDLKEKLTVGLQASNASIISRETILKWVAADFGIENIDEELAKIAAQPVINPYGMF